MQEQNAEINGEPADDFSGLAELNDEARRKQLEVDPEVEERLREMEQQATTELGIQRERAEASGENGTYSEATEAMIDSVQESSDADAEVEFLHAQGDGTVADEDPVPDEDKDYHYGADGQPPEEEPVEVDFSALSEADARSVLFNGLVEMNARLVEVEQRLMLLAQSFVRILEAAGAAEEGTQPQVEVARTMPKMAVPSSKVAHPTRNSR